MANFKQLRLETTMSWLGCEEMHKQEDLIDSDFRVGCSVTIIGWTVEDNSPWQSIGKIQ